MLNCFVDIESGGLNPAVTGITQIAAVAFDMRVDGGFVITREVGSFHTKVIPEDFRKYSREALELQGETKASLAAEGVPEIDALNQFTAFIDGFGGVGKKFNGTIYAHEAAFDWSFMRRLSEYLHPIISGEDIGYVGKRINWVCSKHLFRGLKGIGLVSPNVKENLREIAAYYGVQFPESTHHKPLNDIRAGIAVLPHIYNSYVEIGESS